MVIPYLHTVSCIPAVPNSWTSRKMQNSRYSFIYCQRKAIAHDWAKVGSSLSWVLADFNGGCGARWPVLWPQLNSVMKREIFIAWPWIRNKLPQWWTRTGRYCDCYTYRVFNLQVGFFCQIIGRYVKVFRFFFQSPKALLDLFRFHHKL